MLKPMWIPVGEVEIFANIFGIGYCPRIFVSGFAIRTPLPKSILTVQ